MIKKTIPNVRWFQRKIVNQEDDIYNQIERVRGYYLLQRKSRKSDRQHYKEKIVVFQLKSGDLLIENSRFNLYFQAPNLYSIESEIVKRCRHLDLYGWIVTPHIG